MNIGLLIGRFPPDLIGGAELQTKQLAAELARRGHDVTVFTRRYSGRPYRQWQDGYLIRRRNEFPVPGLRMVWDTFPALWNIAHHRPRPQVLLCYQTLNSGLIGVIAQSLLGIPAIVSVRGNREYRLRSSAINRLLVPGIYRRVQYLIVQSPGMLDDLHARLRLAGRVALSDELQNKVRVVPNGVSVLPDGRADGTKVVYVGRLIRNKGVADLILAMRQLPDAQVLVVGDGPDRGRLESLAQGMPVTFVGQVMPSAVINYLRQARVLVLPSHLGDGLPNVILEAMACGVPVVATRIAGIPDLVRHGETGFLFEPGDVQQMATYIGRILEDDTLWRRLGARGLEVVQSYAWDVVLPQVEQLLLSVISRFEANMFL
jgi:glycosyltransferase involved in cell wall biosynthesis